jgi:ferritin-like metal-binding protein YciE
MVIKTPKELFVTLLSDVRTHEERATRIYQEMSQVAQDSDIKEALESRAYIQNQIVSTLDRCFQLMNEKPVTGNEKLHELFLENFRTEIREIQSPMAKMLYIISKANHLSHWHMGEYVALIAMSDISEHYGISVLLESCLADKVAFAERTRRKLRRIVESKMMAGVV